MALAVVMVLLYATTPRPAVADDTLLVAGILTAIFGAGALLSFLMLSPDRAYLLLTPAGFTVRTLFKRKDYRWGDVEEFHATALKGTLWIVFTLSPQGKTHRSETAFRRMNKAVSGGDDNLPDTYGMSAEALAELLSQWKKRFSGVM